MGEFTNKTGVAERTLLALLAVRIPALGAAGRLSHALVALSAWAFSAKAAAVPRAEGLVHFGEVIELLSAVLSTYRWATGRSSVQVQLS